MVAGVIASEQLPTPDDVVAMSRTVISDDGDVMQFADDPECPGLDVPELVRWGALISGAILAAYGRMVATGPLVAPKGGSPT
jgi:hypothetical protein